MNDNDFQTHLVSIGAELLDDTSHAPTTRHFGNSADEYRAAHADAIVVDLSDRTQIEITGADRRSFLHNFCTNDIKSLEPGCGCEAFVVNVKGRIIGHILVFADEKSLWLDSVPGQQEILMSHLNRYIITEDVELHARTDELAAVLVCGPEAASRLASVGLDTLTMDDLALTSGSIDGVSVVVRRADIFGLPSFLLAVSRGDLIRLWSTIQETGCRPTGADAFHALRIEAGFPLFGDDISDQNLAQEASRTKQAISFTKGCYLGQEPIARIDAIGHVNRMLRSLQFADGASPSVGDKVTSVDGEKEIGTLSSVASQAADGPAIALTCIRSSSAEPGTQVSVHTGEEIVDATVCWIE